jgi:hypothetical protein
MNAVLIAGYTLLDGHGVRLRDQPLLISYGVSYFQD